MTLLSGGKRVYVTPQFELQTIYESPTVVEDPARESFLAIEPERETLLAQPAQPEGSAQRIACLPSLLGFWVDVFYEPMVGERQSRV